MKSQNAELEMRVTSRKHELITEIIEHKKNSSRYGSAEAIDRIKHHLSELTHILKTDKWTDLNAGARLRLAEWVAK